MEFESMIVSLFDEYRVTVHFGRDARNDFLSFDPNIQETILALIRARAMRGPLCKPKGIGEPLHGELHGFVRIKPKHLGLRIVYRPVQKDETVMMEIIAIGPRDKDQVYRRAARRIAQFAEEMARRKE